VDLCATFRFGLLRRQAEGYIRQFQVFIASGRLASLKFPIALKDLWLEAGGRSDPQLALAINTAAILGLLRLHNSLHCRVANGSASVWEENPACLGVGTRQRLSFDATAYIWSIQRGFLVVSA